LRIVELHAGGGKEAQGYNMVRVCCDRRAQDFFRAARISQLVMGASEPCQDFRVGGV